MFNLDEQQLFRPQPPTPRGGSYLTLLGLWVVCVNCLDKASNQGPVIEKIMTADADKT